MMPPYYASESNSFLLDSFGGGTSLSPTSSSSTTLLGAFFEERGNLTGTIVLEAPGAFLKLFSSLRSLMASIALAGTGVIQCTMALTPPEVAQKA